MSPPAARIAAEPARIRGARRLGTKIDIRVVAKSSESEDTVMTDVRYRKNIRRFYNTLLAEIDKVLNPEIKSTYFLQTGIPTRFTRLPNGILNEIVKSDHKIQIDCKGIGENRTGSRDMSLTLLFNKEEQVFMVAYQTRNSPRFVSFKCDDVNGTPSSESINKAVRRLVGHSAELAS